MKNHWTAFQKHWDDFWFSAEYSGPALTAVRIILLLTLVDQITKPETFMHVLGGHENLYFANRFYSPFFSWLSPPPYPVFVWLLRGLTFFSLAALFGIRTRMSLFITSGTFFYIFMLNRFDYLNHMYSLILILFLLGFVPWEKGLALQGRPVFSWSARLIQFTLSFIYLATAISKTTPAWLSGKLMETFLQDNLVHFWGPLAVLSKVPAAAQAWTALFIEYFLAFALWPSKTRSLAIVVGVIFHFYLRLTMSIGTFPLQMVTLYLLFLNRATPQRERV